MLLTLLASLVPQAIDLFTGSGSKASKAVDMALNVAETLTGKKGDEAVSMVDASPELRMEFKKALMADKHVAEKMRYADISDARDMYKHHNQMQDGIAKSIMRFNLWFIAALVAINVGIMIFVPPEYAAAAQGVGTLIGFVINALLKERQDVVGFCFGSSTGSKLKDVGE